jgi:soluble lytic murein transglycosylase-like protein
MALYVRFIPAMLLLLSLMFGTAAIPVALASQGETGPVPELVQSAQRNFERGRALYLEGRLVEARRLFDECHNLLLEADKAGDEALQRRIDRVFTIFYDEMAALDPDIAEELAVIRNQVQRTFKAAPVYAGQVQYFINYLLANKRQFLVNSFRRSLRYIPMIQAEFAKAGIPPDLAHMALIESGFRPDPTSHAGAKGLWQFMPATAKRFGLRVEGSVDERLDPVKSTLAAAQYLLVLHKQFNDWPLAVAAYNCGEGRVSRALTRAKAESYWDLVKKKALPLETQRYVPSIIAVTLISREPVKHGLPSGM